MKTLSRRQFLQATVAATGLQPAGVMLCGALPTETLAGGLTLDELLTNGGGFHLLRFTGVEIREESLAIRSRAGRQIVVGPAENGEPEFTFRIDEHPSYLALHLEAMRGDFSARDTSLAFRRRSGPLLEAFCLDYMGRNDSSAGHLQLTWPYLWNSNPTDPRGAFGMIRGGLTDEARDQALAALWAEGTLPHPDSGKPWTASAAQEWVRDFHTKFAGLSETTLSAANAGELYRLSNWLSETGCRRVYLHTDTWRAEYWPRTRSFVSVNSSVFPRGRDDLKAYRTFLKKKGMLLRLHNVSAGVGLQDPEFVAHGADPRLATWVAGALETEVTRETTEILFRPNPGVSFPHVRLATHWNLKRFRLGAEVVEIGGIEGADGPVWRLRSVRRGFGGVVSAHPVGTAVAGLLCTYGQNYIPDTQSDLLLLMAERYAALINEAELDHQHYDGAEIHVHLEPWGFDKLSSLVAAKVRQPTTTSTSGGRPTKWNFELNFSRIRRLHELGYWAAAIPVLLAEHRNASSWLDAHFEIASRLLRPARRLGFFKPEPMFGVSVAALQGHGLMPQYVELFRDWTKTIGAIGERETAWLRQHLKPVESKLRQRGHHEQSRDVPVLVKAAAGYALVPTCVLVREGVDAPWLTGQEFGPTGPRQYLVAGERVALHNPYPAQPPEVILHVLPALQRQTGQGAAPTAVRPGDATLADYQTGTVSNQAAPGARVSEGRPAGETLWPANAAITPAGDTRLTVAADSLELTAENPTAEPIWEEQRLPSWTCTVQLRGRRGLYLEVEGDGSGAVLVCQLHGRGVRDYVVKVDFNGRRVFTIPNGEAAWAAACWGWRFGAKHFDYDGQVTAVSIGFGYIPPRCTAHVFVRGLELLENVNAPLRDPSVHVEGGVLRVTGEIFPGEYLSYNTESGARVADGNWNSLRTLESAVERWIAPAGRVEVWVEAAPAPAPPWLELQVLTRGEPFPIARAAG